MADGGRKCFKRSPVNSGLLDVINYSSIVQLKKIVKYILKYDDTFNGDSIEFAILSDIKTALGLYESSKHLKVLTPRQKYIITEHIINDRPQTEIADELGITQQGVSVVITSGLNRIKKYLMNESLNWVPWTDLERETVKVNFPRVGAEPLAKRFNREVSSITNMYYYLRRSDRDGSKSCGN